MGSTELRAAQAIAGIKPMWTGQITLGQVLSAQGTPERTLLHAGPPFTAIDSVPAPVRNSMLQAIVFEAWAVDLTDAASLLDSGGIHLAPAQDHDCLVPLAGVISPGMSLHVVQDQAAGTTQYAVINEGMNHCLRVGTIEDGLVEHQHWLHGPYAQWLQERVTQIGPVDLFPILSRSLESGDDGHNRTMAGSALCATLLLEDDGSSLGAEVKPFITGALAFSLNLWMAAAALALRAAQGMTGVDTITKAGGNGIDFGFQVASDPGTWQTMPGSAPRGPVPEQFRGLPVLGAIGDSAVVDFFGLGGQALHHAPATLEALGSFSPGGILDRPDQLMPISHPRLPIRSGVSATRIIETGITPVVLLGMIEASGLEGRIAGGAYEPAVDAFRLTAGSYAG
ncbi:hypothetical protein BLJ79_17730 [Arthrobacter sp. UCD-GKA]|nr:hypothetical protein BLJ79_17730 [Arthrobacter sp. UCD-GKA]